ncbi:MAG: CheR family methyltransferase [Bdellovibrionales bacterium]
MTSPGLLQDLSDDSLREWIQMIHRLTGITISESRRSMVQGRLRKRVLELKLSSYQEYFAYVQTKADEKTIFIDLITTNETYFYRTPRIWDYIEKEFLPQWHKTRPGGNLQAWSAAASSGEEAHTLGILLQNYRSTRADFSYSILGTDISQKMVQSCQQGEYVGKALDHFQKLRPDLAQKFLVPLPSGASTVHADIRLRLKFKTHNLFQPLVGAPKFDLILLRNVLIYFTPKDQEVVLQNVAANLAGDGVLIIGESESLTHIQTPFRSLHPLIYTKASPAELLKQAAS